MFLTCHWYSSGLPHWSSWWWLVGLSLPSKLQESSKSHNIFVANLMITGIISVVFNSILTSFMIIGYAAGVGDFIACRVYAFFILVLILVRYCTYLMISVDKVIAIAFPFKHKKIVKRRVIVGSITAAWLLAILLQIQVFFKPGYVKIAQHGRCISKKGSFLILGLLTTVLPIFTISLPVLILNAFLSYRAYQVQRQIREESRLSGTISNEVNNLKKKQAAIKTQLKPMITLLIVILGSCAVGLLLPLLYFPIISQDASKVYEEIVLYVIDPNLGYLLTLLHPFIFGLYYKQVREQMMKVLKRVTCRNKFNSAVVPPHPQRIAWMWCHFL